MKSSKVFASLKFPNIICDDKQLTFASLCVAATIYAYRNALGYCRLGLEKLARYAGCSVTTTRDALKRLEENGHITIQRNYAWSDKHGRTVRRRDTIVCNRSVKDNFTFISRNALGAGLRKSSFAVYLLICRLSGNARRAYPSLRRIADTLGMGLSTVCRAIKELHATNLLHVEHCVKKNGAHTSNSYFLVQTRKDCRNKEQQSNERQNTTRSVQGRSMPNAIGAARDVLLPSIYAPCCRRKARAKKICALPTQLATAPYNNRISPHYAGNKSGSHQGVLSFLTN